ncbi:hypothetical protein [Parasedimentitalea huanghaiensis]|uniref:RHS repeat-associated core domain-containing protein n=1 Tax=Parasedimentitalea huanghaiensis TaxID=2682100 RepID=A0A6L6WLB0_9RHOB|nr:hypothetical protein [Zongyanglinia huanghaiensis]MVO18120.1 hypothetical protein [Zongyanglinia huanghaiensis]
MLRYLQQVLFTTLFAILASQASAMFIQPDWFEVTEPGVGTNRYSYSQNDPVNFLDPTGNQAGPGIGALYGLAVDEDGNVNMDELEAIHDAFNKGMKEGVVPDPSVLFDGELTADDLIEGIGLIPGGKAAKVLEPIIGAMRGAGKTSEEIVEIFRAVSPEELQDIAEYGFRLKEGAMDAKQFANSLTELQSFAKHFPDLTKTVKVEIPKSALDGVADLTPVDPMIFRSGTVTIHKEDLGYFNNAIRSISEIFK